ncbi:MAG: isochorismatase family protein [Acidobacteria bacterium]|nr:isochorismatase family protein [Acidobacteriota bacterium]
MTRHRTVFVDVDTQADFMLPHGKLYVPGAEKIIPTIERLRDFAEEQGVPVITSVDAHATDDLEFAQWPPHCVRATPGQLKVPASLLSRYMVVPQERRFPLTDAELSRYQQWILEKDDLDLFTNPQADDLVRRLNAEQYVVYGVATEYCVRLAVLGLLERKRSVLLLLDAIREIEAEGGRKALQEMQAAGAKLLNTEDVLATFPARPAGAANIA